MQIHVGKVKYLASILVITGKRPYQPPELFQLGGRLLIDLLSGLNFESACNFYSFTDPD